MSEKTFTIKCNEHQLRMINTALEEYMRIGFGQFRDLSDRLAFKGFDSQKNKSTFEARINSRDAAEVVFKAAMDVAQPNRYFDKGIKYKSEDELLVEDLRSIIRHELWNSRDDTCDDHWCVDAHPPLILSKDSSGFEVACDRK